MENESKKNKNFKKALAYVNIHKRTINLSKLGFLEEIKSDLINMHSRRDYKVTLKGIEQLIPYFLTHPDEVGNTVQYMNKFKIDKKTFGNLLSNKFKSMIKTMSLYIGSTTYIEPLPLDMIQIDHLQRATFEFNLRLNTIQRSIQAHPRPSPILQKQLEDAKERGDIATVDYLSVPPKTSSKIKKQEKRLGRRTIKEPEIDKLRT